MAWWTDPCHTRPASYPAHYHMGEALDAAKKVGVGPCTRGRVGRQFTERACSRLARGITPGQAGLQSLPQ